MDIFAKWNFKFNNWKVFKFSSDDAEEDLAKKRKIFDMPVVEGGEPV